MKRIFISLLFLSQMSNAQVELVKDIRASTSSSLLSGFVSYNSKLYLKATDGVVGSELWSSDGTTAGTSIVADFNPGSVNFNPTNLTPFNGKLYFSGLTATYGSEMYSFDGSSISIAADIKAGTAASAPGYILTMGGNLYFRAQEATSTTYRLYKMNSSNAYNIVDNTLLCGLSATAYGNQLIFNAGTTSGSLQLYTTDGSTTSLLKTINSSATPSISELYTAPTLNKVFFQATDGTNGKELWITDGTTTGTVMLADINSGSGDSSPANFYEYNGKVYFSANDGTNGVELWVTDGTSAGTKMLKDINTSVAGANSNPSNFYAYNGKLYFSANDGTNGVELWRTDGTAGNTQILLDINSGAGNSSPSDLISFNGDLYLAADAGVVGKELYKISASTLGLEKVKATSLKVYPNPSNGNINFSSPITGKYSLYTYAGNLVSSGFIAKQKELQLKVSSGNYLLVVDQNGDKKTFNIVVNN